MRISAFIDEWRGTLLVAVTYIYFLIFAQFAFLARLEALGFADSGLKLVMAAMAVGGILLSLLMPRFLLIVLPDVSLRIGFGVSGAAALCASLALSRTGAAIVAFLIGSGLGIVTVTLVAYLRLWTGSHHMFLKVGLGTGLGYLVCNIPAVFTARPENQSMFAALLFFGAMALPLGVSSDPVESPNSEEPQFPFFVALTSFAALVWLDSAAFYIIQHASALKAATWLGSRHLWANGSLHLGAAIVAALLLQRKRTSLVLASSFGALGLACILLLRPGLILPASLLYPVGVSLYSVTLVAYPSFLSPAGSIAGRARQAGFIYALAGWVGSGLGISMGQNLGQVPSAFVAVAGSIVLAPIVMSLAKARAREVSLLLLILTVGFVLNRALPSDGTGSSSSAVDRGRHVYISEGCISCHSQYVRPNSADTLMWGPPETIEQIHQQKPPLIGNRRQGPDLAQVGSRRSPLWLKAHLIDPREISYRSIMPPYGFLFCDRRGDDLVAYLTSLKSPSQSGHLIQESGWQPSGLAVREADLDVGRIEYEHHCATCHDRDGATRSKWQSEFKKLPPTIGALGASSAQYSSIRLAQIIKFGISGTDMPGHEYLSDREIASLTLWLAHPRAQPPPYL